jgi:hypothetical protein
VSFVSECEFEMPHLLTKLTTPARISLSLSIFDSVTRHGGDHNVFNRHSLAPRPSTPKEGNMKYFVVLASEGTTWDDLTADEQQADMERLEAFDRACAEREGVEILAAEALESGSTSTTVRITQSREVTITDGPFAEAAEHIGAFYLLEAPDLDAVIAVCQVLPAYAIDIRPVVNYG